MFGKFKVVQYPHKWNRVNVILVISKVSLQLGNQIILDSQNWRKEENKKIKIWLWPDFDRIAIMWWDL